MKRSVLVLLWLPAIGSGDESHIQLKDGAGKELVAAKCAICHSLDYIPMNAPFLGPADWEKVVDKMVGTMGAPVSDEEVPVVLRYLNTNYGQ
ncbi:MAG: cytochrome c [Methylotetracoccus sp.]|jgi:mono/diheme cytochrome c family protein|nr:cytochrome c [Methylotetracoccus sp.]